MTFTKTDGQVSTAAEINSLYYRTAWDFLPIGGDGADGALTVAAGTTNISGLKRYTTVTVNNGATLNIQGPTLIMATGAVSISGAITSDNNTTGGACVETGQSGTVAMAGLGGKTGQAILRYQYLRMPLGGGSGGTGGNGATRYNSGGSEYYFSGGGGGGGAGYISGGAGGDTAAASGSTAPDSTASGGAGGSGKYGLCIETQSNLTFGATAVVTLTGNAGSACAGNDGGGGGGAGGASLQCFALGNLTYTAGAAINSIGGAGGAGDSSNPKGGNGGGGGGGFVKFWYKGSLTNSGTTTVTGGAAGSGGNGGSAGSAGLFETQQIESF